MRVNVWDIVLVKYIDFVKDVKLEDLLRDSERKLDKISKED